MFLYSNSIFISVDQYLYYPLLLKILLLFFEGSHLLANVFSSLQDVFLPKNGLNSIFHIHFWFSDEADSLINILWKSIEDAKLWFIIPREKC